MSSTTTGIDARGYLIGWLQAVTGMMAADIAVIPEDKWDCSMGGCTQPASEMVAHLVMNLRWTAAVLNDQAPQTYDQIPGFTTTFTDQPAAISALRDASSELAAALAAADDALLNRPFEAPWGMTLPIYLLAQIAVSHVWYHDGQLNYVQCLLGDNQEHWRS